MSDGVATPATELRETHSRTAPYAVFSIRAWEERFPGLRAGITAAAADADFRVTHAPSEAHVRDVYERLGAQLGFGSQAVARQVHGTRIVRLDGARPRGLLLVGEADGIVSDRAGVLCCVTAADCVPVFVLDAESGAIAVLHGGWRGIAAGILEAGMAAMAGGFGSRPESLAVHFGPAICRSCYEVGPEVADALGVPSSGRSTTVDLRAELRRRALRRGVRPAEITSSTWCTRCSPDLFHSHRGKGLAAGRMAAFLGWLPLAEP